MAAANLEEFPFTQDGIRRWATRDEKHRNWPVVYVMTNETKVYIGESLDAANRMRQHLDSPEKQGLESVRVVLDDTFHKSACLDLESFLIRLFSGEGRYQVLNSNAGITDRNYYDRSRYQRSFNEVFEALRTQEQLFTRSLPEIINSDLFKFSPFKALNQDQAIAVEDILEGLFADLESGETSTVVVHGNPGTGKTIVAIYILKLLADIKNFDGYEGFDSDALFSDFFTEGYAKLLSGLRIGFVVPQQSLRESVARVFTLTPGLDRSLALTPFQVGENEDPFDLLIVDEAHRLNQRASQASGRLNRKFAEINTRLFGTDDPELTQLDWVRKQSKHTLLLLDTGQSVRPADLSPVATQTLLDEASANGRVYPLQSQMRISAEQDYVGYVRAVLSTSPPEKPIKFTGYDLRFFEDLRSMRSELSARETEHGLSRLVAGYAWPWHSKKNKSRFDIEIEGEQLRWNSTLRDWINSADSIHEVGSIHTVQGYDLNFTGVIIGEDLRFDTATNRIVFQRHKYFDAKGRENNRRLRIKYSDEQLLRYITNIYGVLLTRGILGTYLYVCDLPLRDHLRRYFSS